MKGHRKTTKKFYDLSRDIFISPRVEKNKKNLTKIIWQRQPPQDWYVTL